MLSQSCTARRHLLQRTIIAAAHVPVPASGATGGAPNNNTSRLDVTPTVSVQQRQQFPVVRTTTDGVRTFGTRAVCFLDPMSSNRRNKLPGVVLFQKQLFSTAAQVEESTEQPITTTKAKTARKPRRSLIDDKNPIIVTDRAAARIRELLQGESAVAAGAVGLRLGVKRRGCNGLSYTLNYATAETVKAGKDIPMESHGIQVYIDPMALFNVVGTVMDWEESEMASEFTFQNPNSKGECGCGESFNV
jgi:iron-sulfur cluster assembly accessory protein